MNFSYLKDRDQNGSLSGRAGASPRAQYRSGPMSQPVRSGTDGRALQDDLDPAVLGLAREKLYVIPFEALKLDASREHFTLDVDKEKLKNAPGFDMNHPPKATDHRHKLHVRTAGHASEPGAIS
jgi:hypothetical protein